MTSARLRELEIISAQTWGDYFAYCGRVYDIGEYKTDMWRKLAISSKIRYQKLSAEYYAKARNLMGVDDA